MAEDPRDGELERFLAERGGHLLRAAVLLTGSKEAGEDLVQAALERLLRRGSAVHRGPGGVPAADHLPPGRRRLAPRGPVAGPAGAAAPRRRGGRASQPRCQP
jgi:hypothetical protein